MPDANWKIQIWIQKNDMYLSSYANIFTGSWITTYFRKGEEIGRGTFSFPGLFENELEFSKEEEGEIILGEFDSESLPSIQYSDEKFQFFEHSFQFAAGPNYVSYINAQNGTEEFT